jgi:hypothetical protein
MRTSFKIRKVNSCTMYNSSDLNKDDKSRLKYRSSTGTEEFWRYKEVIISRRWTVYNIYIFLATRLTRFDLSGLACQCLTTGELYCIERRRSCTRVHFPDIKTRSRPRCLCVITYFKLNVIDTVSIITKLRII